MSKLKEIVKNIREGKTSAAQDLLNEELTNRANKVIDAGTKHLAGAIAEYALNSTEE